MSVCGLTLVVLQESHDAPVSRPRVLCSERPAPLTIPDRQLHIYIRKESRLLFLLGLDLIMAWR
jgi:hypothetical protein